jgi:GxxExxY protein
LPERRKGVKAKPSPERPGAGGLRHGELAYRLIGCAQKVHRQLGPGFPETVYQRALCHEMAKAKIPFESEKLIEVFYDGVICGQFRLDALVDGKVIVELKALDGLNDQHLAQAISYLKAAGLGLGLLVNFGQKSLEVKRVVL